jgi:hypothetical protein
VVWGLSDNKEDDKDDDGKVCFKLGIKFLLIIRISGAVGSIFKGRIG